MFHRRNDQDKFPMENDFNCRSLGDCIMLRSWTRCSTSKPQWSTKTENAQIWTGISKPIEFEMIIFYYGALCSMHCVRLHSSIVIVRRWCDFIVFPIPFLMRVRVMRASYWITCAPSSTFYLKCETNKRHLRNFITFVVILCVMLT